MRLLNKIWHWLYTGHWPKKMRFPHGIPRVDQDTYLKSKLK